MAAQKGKDLLIKIADGAGFVAVAGLKARTISLNAKSVDVTDVNELPMAYKDVIVELRPKKKLLKEALELGFEIDGVQLVPKTIITIR